MPTEIDKKDLAKYDDDRLVRITCEHPSRGTCISEAKAKNVPDRLRMIHAVSTLSRPKLYVYDMPRSFEPLSDLSEEEEKQVFDQIKQAAHDKRREGEQPEPHVGCVALEGAQMGMITDPAKEDVKYGNGEIHEAWTGVQLGSTEDTEAGELWHSTQPTVLLTRYEVLTILLNFPTREYHRPEKV